MTLTARFQGSKNLKHKLFPHILLKSRQNLTLYKIFKSKLEPSCVDLLHGDFGVRSRLVRFNGFLLLDGLVVAESSTLGQFLLPKLISDSVQNELFSDVQATDFEHFKGLFG